MDFDRIVQLVDYFNAVERLHSLEINKIIPKLKTDARWATVPRHNKTPSKISVNKLIRGLPTHIMGCLLTKQPDPSSSTLETLTEADIVSSHCYEHVSKAWTLLSTLSNMCSEVPPLRDNGAFGPDANFTAELIDAANLSLLAIAGPEADTIISSSGSNQNFSDALTRAELVPAALRAVALITSAFAAPDPASPDSRYNWRAVCEAVFNHPRGAIMVDAAFEASRVLVRAVREALCSATVPGDSVYALAYAAGGAMELVTAFCASPLFYYRMMLHDPEGAAPLRLVLSCLAIHDAPMAAPPFKRVPESAGSARPILAAMQPPYTTDKGSGAAELLAARGFALLLLLGEYDAPTYLDEVFSASGTRGLAEDLVGRAAAYVGQVLLRPPPAEFQPATGEAQMSINVLRAAELLSDDSNFRVALIPGLAPALAQLLAHSNSERFSSMWCLGEEAVSMMGQDSALLVNSTSKNSYDLVDKYAAASKEYHGKGFGVGKVSGLSGEELKVGRLLALERSILMSKLLVNLHYYNETLPVALKDAFVSAFVAYIEKSAPEPSAQAAALTQAATNVENLLALAWKFGPPEALKGIELMAEVDMEQSRDLLVKLKAAAEEAQRVAKEANGGKSAMDIDTKVTVGGSTVSMQGNGSKDSAAAGGSSAKKQQERPPSAAPAAAKAAVPRTVGVAASPRPAVPTTTAATTTTAAMLSAGAASGLPLQRPVLLVPGLAAQQAGARPVAVTPAQFQLLQLQIMQAQQMQMRQQQQAAATAGAAGTASPAAAPGAPAAATAQPPAAPPAAPEAPPAPAPKPEDPST